MADIHNMQQQQLETMMAAQYGLPMGYQPRFTTPSMGPPQGTSLASMGQQLGPMGAQLGMVGDLLLPAMLGSQYQTFMTSLGMARSNDVGHFIAQQRIQSLMSSMGAQDLMGVTRAAAGFLGFSDEAAGRIAPFAPMLDQLTGGGLTGIARLADPALMTARGAAGIVEAQRRLDSMGRLDEARSLRMQRQIQERGRLDASGRTLFDARRLDPELGDDDFRLRNDLLTAGFNMDDFGEIVAMAADLGLRDRSAGQSRAEIARFRAAAGRDRPGASPDEINALVRSQQDDASIIGASTQFAQVLRTLQGTLGQGMSLGQLGNLAVGMGAIPGQGGDVAALQDAIRQIQALGDAAGMSSEQMVQAGMVLQRQYGGTLGFNMAAAASAQSAQRLFSGMAGDADIQTHRGMSDALSARGATAMMETSQARVSGVLAAALMDPARAAEIAAAAGDPERLAGLIQGLTSDPELMMRGGQMRPDQVTAALEHIQGRVGLNTFMGAMALGVEDELIANARVTGSGVAGLMRGMRDLEDDAFTLLHAAVTDPLGIGVLSSQQFATLDTATGGQARAMVAAAATRQEVFDFLGVHAGRRGLGATADARTAAVEERAIAEALSQSPLGAMGLGRFVSKIQDDRDFIGAFLNDPTAALVNLGVISSEEEKRLMTTALSNADMRAKIAGHLSVLVDPDTNQEAKARARSGLQTMGVGRGAELDSADVEAAKNMVDTISEAAGVGGSWIAKGFQHIVGMISGGGRNAAPSTPGPTGDLTVRLRLDPGPGLAVRDIDHSGRGMAFDTGSESSRRA